MCGKMAAAALKSVLRQCQTLKTVSELCRVAPVWHISHARYAAKKEGVQGKAMAAGTLPSRHLEDIETDTIKLTTMLCGGNIMKEGSDPVLKEDSEYPDWLWNLHTDRRPVPLEELDPDTYAYWRRLRKIELRRQKQMMKVKYKWKIF